MGPARAFSEAIMTFRFSIMISTFADSGLDEAAFRSGCAFIVINYLVAIEV